MSARTPAAEAAAAAGLLEQAQADDLDVVREGLAHVVDGERRDGRSGERLHLHPRAVMHADRAAHDELAVALLLDFDLAVLEPQRVAEGNELVCTLGGQNAG